MNPRRLLSLAALLLLAAGLCQAAELTVYAAASLSDVLRELAPRFTASTAHTLRFNFGGSGILARQLGEGARADVFVAADELRMDQLEKAGLLRPDSRCILVLNTLVLVVPADAEPPLDACPGLALPGVRHLAIGNPATVPAGSYARDYLVKQGLWTALQGKLVTLDSVRAVLAAVESGNAEAGFVYRTDALISRKTRIAFSAAGESCAAIRYPAAVLAEAAHPAEAAAFVAWLRGPEAGAIFLKHGFLLP